MSKIICPNNNGMTAGSTPQASSTASNTVLLQKAWAADWLNVVCSECNQKPQKC